MKGNKCKERNVKTNLISKRSTVTTCAFVSDVFGTRNASSVLLVAIEGCGVSVEELGAVQVEGVEVRKVHCRNEYKDIHEKLKGEKMASYKAVVVLAVGTNHKEVLLKGNTVNGDYSNKRINTKKPKEHEKTTTINLDEVQKQLDRQGHSAKQLTGGQKSSSYTLYKILAVNQKSVARQQRGCSEVCC